MCMNIADIPKGGRSTRGVSRRDQGKCMYMGDEERQTIHEKVARGMFANIYIYIINTKTVEFTHRAIAMAA